MARKIGRRYFALRTAALRCSRARCQRLAIMSCNSASTSPRRSAPNTVARLSPRPRTSQRGLCGMVNSMRKNSAAGHRDAQLPSPLRRRPNSRDQSGSSKVGEQNPRDHVELEESHQPSALIGRRDLGNVHRPDHRRSPNRQPADESEEQQRRPIPGQRASQRRKPGRRWPGCADCRACPRRSPGMLAARAPITVPHKAIDTVSPNPADVRA